MPRGLLLTPKCRPRKAAPAKAASAKLEPMRTPARGGPPDLQEGAWARVKDGALTGRRQPESTWELESWGADVVARMYSRRASGDAARGIVEAVVSASALKDHIVCLVHPCRADYTAGDCQQLARFVAFADSHLTQGNRVVAICRRVVQQGGGGRRTGIAIYLPLR